MIFTINQTSADSTTTATTSNQTESDDSAVQNKGPKTLYCKNHPNSETLLRCNKCNEPICMKCSVQTAVGFRCKECIHGLQDKYFNAERMDYPIAFLTSMVVTAIVSPIAGRLLGSIGLLFVIFIMILIGSGAGSLLAQIVRRAVGNRRGRYLRQFMIAGVVVGLLLGTVVGLFFNVWVLNLPTLIFAVFVSVTAYQLIR